MIKSVCLERFKNFHNATLTLGPLTVIVGTNASGKSNLRDAFRFIHGMSRGYTLAETIGEKYVEGGVLQWRGIRGGTREAVSFGSDTFSLETAIQIPNNIERTGYNGHGEWHARHHIEVWPGDAKSSPRARKESFYDNAGLIFDSHGIDDTPAQEGPEYLFVRLPRDDVNRKHGKRLRFISTQPIISQFPKHREARVRYKKPAECFISELTSMRFLDLSPEAMKIPSVPGQIVLGDRGENLSSVLQAICDDESTKRSVAEWIRELTPLDVVDFEFLADQTGKVLVNLVESNGLRTSAYSASDGTLRFLAMIAALFGPDAAKFYYLEEIDNGIHPTRLYLLLQLLEQRAREGKVQIITTTHSPQLLAMLSDEAREHASIVYRQEGEQNGIIRRIMDIPEARRVLEEQNLARLHESGWLEDSVAFEHSMGADP